MSIKIIFKWFDFWVGFFWDSKKSMLYFFPVPMFGVVFRFCKHVWVHKGTEFVDGGPFDPDYHIGRYACPKCGKYKTKRLRA